MDRATALIVIVVILIGLAGFGLYSIVLNRQQEPMPVSVIPSPLPPLSPLPLPPMPTPQDDKVRVATPQAGHIITSPVIVEGEARGIWYFEASFPIRVADANGKVLGTGIAQAQKEWMTTDFVPFRATVTFSQPTTEDGVLILQKDNPSGLPEHDDDRRLPIRFDTSAAPRRTIKLYYYDENKDTDATGNVLCTTKGLVAVERKIPTTSSPAQDTLRLLIKGELTSEERAAGIATEYPLAGLELKSVILNSGVLTLTFVDPQGKTSGGSCRVNVLRSQIEATARQFPTVTQVKILPEELFQP